MEARNIYHLLVGMAIIATSLCRPVWGQFGHARQHVAHSENFIVFADSPAWAAEVAKVAEQHRRELAIYWLGHELPPWSERIPVHVTARPDLGAGGETRFSLLPQGVGNWMMSVQGTRERVLDSVLPHEITHTIFATHFAPLGKYVPRWADEGACTTVEHEAEKRKHAYFLQQFLRTGRGIAFNRMFSLKEYPDDILPLYAQGHSAVQFLLDQAGPRTFIRFLEDGMRTEQWEAALRKHYAYETIGRFQVSWNQWLADGSPTDLTAYAPLLQREKTPDSVPHTAAPVTLAVGDTASPTTATLASAETSEGSWYRRRWQESSGATLPHHAPTTSTAPPMADTSSPATALANAPLTDASMAPAVVPPQRSSLPPAQGVARPQPPQSPAVQVLDWGASQPIPGVDTASRGPLRSPQAAVEMVPLYR
ncbi:MAG: hypothetical protein KatS3mg111_1279 [Pirellulaceae bacterium]|nr:MAG: hypothetical protein KatS3mg111_1279 [Pirellulaceae bacterium]